MVTKSVKSVQMVDAVKVDVAVTASNKATAASVRLDAVLLLLGRTTAKPVDAATDIKWGKAIGLLGGGSVYINRGNADVRASQKQVSDWSKSIEGSTVRGPQGQYLRIAF